MRFFSALALAFVLLAAIPAARGDETAAAELHSLPLIPVLGGPGDAMFQKRESVVEQGRFEFSLSFAVWHAYLAGKTESSTYDLRQAEWLLNLRRFDTSLARIDFVEDLRLPKSRMIINPELYFRVRGTALRLSWWWLREQSRFRPDKIFAYGDVIYAEDPDGAAAGGNPNNRIPPDPVPDPLTPAEITFSSEMMDTKLMLERRSFAGEHLEVYAGIGLHWLRLSARSETETRIFQAIEDGSIVDREPMTSDKINDIPLLSISMRAEWRPSFNVCFSLDVQEMYLYAFNYTDLKIGAWTQFAPGARVGVGARLWNLSAKFTIAMFDINLTYLDVNVALMGGWACLIVTI